MDDPQAPKSLSEVVYEYCDVQPLVKMDDLQETKSLSKMFEDGLDLYNALSKTDEPTNSSSFQANVKRAINILESATRLTSLSGVFADNESIDEIATADLQYFLLPALLGSLSLKLTSGDRKEIVDVAEIYFKDFLQRCHNYGLTNYNVKDKHSNEKENNSNKSEIEKLQGMANTRANKIQRFNEKKELQSKLEDLKRNMANENADEDIKRNYFLTMIKLYIHEAIDELSSIEMEKPILEHMANIKQEDKPKPKRQPVQPLKPIIITRDEVQKAVFGAGYPSLPTMTVEEFYEKRVREGDFPGPNKKSTASMSLQDATMAGISVEDEDIEKESKIEKDDPETLARARAMDEFKDDHRRGWGNRMNRS